MAKTRWLLGFMALAALVGMVAMAYATAQGVGLSPDSTVYLGSARSLLAGQGLLTQAYDGTLQPMTHYPPLYPAMLALVGLGDVDVLDAARWLGVLLYGANIALVGWLVYRLSRGDALLAAPASLATLFARNVFMVHSWAWSEAPFVTLGFLGLLWLHDYMSENRRVNLWLAGAALGLALLTRYLGLALVATAVLWRLVSGPGRLGRRIGDAVILGALGGLPLVGWFIRNLVVSGGLANRSTVYHAITSAQWEAGFKTLAKWVLPGQIAQASVGWAVLGNVAGVALLGSLLLVWLGRREAQRPPSSGELDAGLYAPLLPGLFVVIYIALVLLSMSFFDANTPLDDRILLPAWMAGVICLLAMAGRLLHRAPWWTRLAPLALALALAIPQAKYSLAFCESMHTHGEGYGSNAWRRSALVDQVRALPAETPLISNGPDVIYALTGRTSAWLPYLVHAGTRQVNAQYDEELREVARSYGERDGRVVYFTAITFRSYLPTRERLLKDLPLEPVVEVADGAIYRIDNARD